MDNVALFNINLTIHPVHRSLFRVEFLYDFVLFSAVLSFNFMVLDLLQLDEVSSVLKASQLDFITTQMNDGIWEDVNNFCEDLSDQFVSLFESDVERAHVPVSEGTGDVLVLRGESPAGGMTRSVEFRDDSDSSNHGVPDEFSCVSCGVGLLLAEGSVLGDFWVRVQDQWESILVSDVPVENTQFIVHHGIDGFIEQVHG